MVYNPTCHEAWRNTTCLQILLSLNMENKIHVYDEKRISMIALWCPTFIIMADFLMPETQQPIMVTILIIYSSYFLKNLVEC